MMATTTTDGKRHFPCLSSRHETCAPEQRRVPAWVEPRSFYGIGGASRQKLVGFVSPPPLTPGSGDQEVFLFRLSSLRRGNEPAWHATTPGPGVSGSVAILHGHLATLALAAVQKIA